MKRINLDRHRLPRNRQVRACQHCRLAKVKCDKGQPGCQRCEANNRSCVYVDQAKPTKHVHRGRDQPIWPNQAGHLKPAPDAQVRYYSSASWFFALEDRKPDCHGQDRQQALRNADYSPTTSTRCVSHDTDADADADGFHQIYVHVLPAEVDRLVCWYAEYCHLWYPIVDIAAVMATLEGHRNGHFSNAPAGSAALVSSICYIASCSLTVYGDVSIISTYTRWRNLAQDLLDKAGYPSRPNLQMLRAAFLLALQSISEFPAHSSLAPISTLIRTAQFLGIHRDPLMLSISADEADAQRVIWWSIHSLDVGHSLAHALPTITHPMHSDVKPLSRTDNSDCILLSTVIQVNEALGKVFEGIYGIQTPTEWTLNNLDAEVERICKSEVAHTKLPQDSRAKFIVISQACCCWKLKFILHQPYLRSPQWPRSSRSKALDASIKYIRDFTVGMTDPSLVSYRWVLNHFNIFHACGIIIQDLISFPESSEAFELRGVIESSFESFYTESDPTWKRLETLRFKAWSVNGWDGIGLEMADMEVGLSDWDPLFASLPWSELSSLDFE